MLPNGVAVRLNDKVAKSLQIPDGKTELLTFDDDLPNFGLRIRSGGKRTWICQYRPGRDKQRRVTLGSVANMDAADARREAKTLLSKVQLGLDPQTEKFTQRDKASVTLSSVVEKYLSTYGALHLKPRTLVEVTRSLKVHWAPLGEVPIHKLSRSAIANQLDAIAAERGPFAANRARSYLSGLFSWAVQRGYADDNPVRFTGKPAPEASRDRVLTDRELGLVFRHAGDGDYGDIIRLLALTGQRREEVGGMRWSEVDLEAGTWTIPPDRTKNGLPHEVPLSIGAQAILTSRTRREGRDLVFGAGGGPFSGWSNCKSALDLRIHEHLKKADPNAAALKAWRIHDLRRTTSTRMSDHGVPPHVVEAVLNHVSGTRAGVAGVYNRAVYRPEKTTALNDWGSHISSISRGDG